MGSRISASDTRYALRNGLIYLHSLAVALLHIISLRLGFVLYSLQSLSILDKALTRWAVWLCRRRCVSVSTLEGRTRDFPPLGHIAPGSVADHIQVMPWYLTHHYPVRQNEASSHSTRHRRRAPMSRTALKLLSALCWSNPQ
jgi:hypothetical protein